MDFVGSGSIRFRGCADYTTSDYLFIPFGEGSQVFVCAKARVGLLQKIIIKRIKIIRNHRTWGQPVIQYYDTTNRIWFPQELCEEESAISLAKAYLTAKMARIAALDCPLK